MIKRWSRKAKQKLILDTIAEAVLILRLEHWQIEVSFEEGLEERAGCHAVPHYRTAEVGFDVGRIRIFECVEFAVHELVHIHTWQVATLLEQLTVENTEARAEAERAYEHATTEWGQNVLPMVMARLEEKGLLPPEAKEQPTIIVKPHRRLPTLKTKPEEPLND